MSRRDDIYGSDYNGSSQRRQTPSARQRFAGGQQRTPSRASSGSSQQRSRSQVQQPQRSRQGSASARDYSRDRYVGGQRQGTRPQQAAGRRPAQGAQAPRQQMPQRGMHSAPANNMANRYSRSNGAYQARPNQAANAARAAEGVLSTPLSFVIRLALVVILVAVFGVRMVLSGSDSAQLKELQTTIASQQETLDGLTADNQSMQSSIDSRQSTIDEYNKLL
ncbi:MAG: hypothetical protein PUD96_03410 [Coriobacteriaceae bacterium]|nr:hypothetical protein [Coriobacteriaceae bacterium]